MNVTAILLELIDFQIRCEENLFVIIVKFLRRIDCYRFKGFLGLSGLNESRIVFCDYTFWFNRDGMVVIGMRMLCREG